ncbi:hypothetical protein RV12_GL002211 [Enterococcus quebecensis]|nr:hypothetical protein RV12_GL002211 [Enterococcus quebecensis]
MYDDTHQQLIDNYCLSKRKLRYVREPKIAISLTKKNAQRHAVLVFEDDSLVAFLTLYETKGGSPYSSNEHHLLVQDLSIDYRHFRVGYTKQAFELLPAFIRQHWPKINQLTIIVNEDKAFTQPLCKHAGFKDTGNTLPPIYGSQVFLQISI